MTPEMAKAVVEFLHAAWPMQAADDPQRRGWDHLFSTSYQIACMAMVALGQAEETVWGAVAKPDPRLPDLLPFWEDIAVAVLWLAGQQNLLTYRPLDGSVPPARGSSFLVRRIDGPPPALPNIRAGRGSGPAIVADMVLPALDTLGLIRDGRWTEMAETVLWRGRPRVWGVEFETDARFLTSVEATVAAMPGAVREEIAGLMRISGDDVAVAVAQSARAHEELAIRYGRPPSTRPYTVEQARRSLMFRRESDLDWVFFRQWRLPRGWLDDDQCLRRLEIFHDRLAIAMRKAVVARLYPSEFVWE